MNVEMPSMSWLQRAITLLILAALTGFAGAPILAIVFTVAGLLMLDALLIAGLLRLLGRLRFR